MTTKFVKAMIGLNTWMNDAQYLSQVGHFLGGGSIVLLTFLFTWSKVAVLIAIASIAVAAAIKEFWYDANYELPKQTRKDNLMDFAFYVIGSAVAGGITVMADHVVISSLRCR